MTDLVPFVEPSVDLDVPSKCDAIEAWAETCDSIPHLDEWCHRLDAWAGYLASKSEAGRNRVATAKVRLQARIGVLIGPATRDHDRTPGAKSIAPDIGRHDRSDFRRMAENPDVVDDVIAESTDAEPPSRRKVMERIAEIRRQAEDTPAPAPAPRRGSLVDQASNAGWALRKAVERMERIAADDRYPAYRTQVAAHNRGHLAYAVEVCQDLHDGLDTSPQEGQ